MLRDLASLVGGQLASRLLGFVAFAYLARVLEREAYGAVEFAVALATVAGILIDAGVGTIGVRRLTQGRQSVERIAAEVLSTRLAVSAAAAAGLGFAGWLVVPDPTARGLVGLYALSLICIPWAQAWLFQGAGKIGYAALVGVIRMTTFVAGVLLVVRGSADAVAVGAVEIAAVALAGLCAAGFQIRHVTPLRLSFDFRAILSLVRESLPVGLSNVIWAVNQYLPPLLVASLAGLAAAALFSAGHRIYVALSTFIWIYHFNLFPAISRRLVDGRAEVERLVTDSLRLSAWASIGVAMVAGLAAEPLLAAVFGAEYQGAGPPFALLVWTLPIMMLSGHPRWTLVASGFDRAVTAALAVGMALTVGVGALLVPAIGPLGGAAAILAAGLAVWGLMHTIARRRLGWMPWRPVLLPATTAGLLWLIARWSDATALVESLSAAAAFTLLGLLLDRQLLGALGRLARERARTPPEIPEGA